MFCKNCGAELQENNVCSNCGWSPNTLKNKPQTMSVSLRGNIAIPLTVSQLSLSIISIILVILTFIPGYSWYYSSLFNDGCEENMWESLDWIDCAFISVIFALMYFAIVILNVLVVRFNISNLNGLNFIIVSILTVAYIIVNVVYLIECEPSFDWVFYVYSVLVLLDEVIVVLTRRGTIL